MYGQQINQTGTPLETPYTRFDNNSKARSNKLLKILRKIVNCFTWIEDKVLTIMPFLLLLVSTFAVFNRYFLKYSMGWYEEISLYLYMLLVYWGASKAAKDGTHYSVNLIIDKYQGRTRHYMNLFIWLVCLSISLLGAYFGVQMAMVTTMKTVSLRIPNSIILFTTIAMGFLGMSLKYLYKIIEQIKSMIEENSQAGAME